MPQPSDHYAELGVPTNADDATISAAYLTQIRELAHAQDDSLIEDRNTRLATLDAAFAILSNPSQRAQYDQERTALPWDDLPAADRRPQEPQKRPEKAYRIRAGAIPAWAWVGGCLALAGLVRTTFGLTAEPQASNPAASAQVSAPTTDASIAPNIFVEWNADKDGSPKRYIFKDMSVTLSSSKDGDGQSMPILSITRSGAKPFTVKGQVGGASAAANFGVGRIDPKRPDAQVLFMTYSGGAHCCTQVDLIEPGSKGWHRIPLGSWDGEGPAAFPSDIDGDGIIDIIKYDQRFAYTFSSYADSYMPPLVYNIVDGRLMDVSDANRYANLYTSNIEAARSKCATHNNGACAAYVAIAARLGQHDVAWADMLQSYDPVSSWSPVACAVPQKTCPKDQVTQFSSFPAALAWFLVNAGYPYWSASESSAARGPSFECSNVQNFNLRLVCATPALSLADKTLSEAYKHAVETLPDPSVLQSGERAWLELRDKSPPDIDKLLALYTARIAAIQTSNSSIITPTADPTNQHLQSVQPSDAVRARGYSNRVPQPVRTLNSTPIIIEHQRSGIPIWRPRHRM